MEELPMKLGIELTKDVSKDIIMLAKKGVDAYVDDKEISASEWGGIVMKVIPVLTDLTKAKQIIAEIKDFDKEEGVEYLKYIASLGIVNEKVEEVANLIVGYIEYQINGYELYAKPIYLALKK